MGEDLGFPGLGVTWPPILFGLPGGPGTTPTGAPNGQPTQQGSSSVPWWQFLLTTALSGLVFWRQSDLQSQAIRQGGGVSFQQGQPSFIGQGAGPLGGGTLLLLLGGLLLVILISR